MVDSSQKDNLRRSAQNVSTSMNRVKKEILSIQSQCEFENASIPVPIVHEDDSIPNVDVLLTRNDVYTRDLVEIVLKNVILLNDCHNFLQFRLLLHDCVCLIRNEE